MWVVFFVLTKNKFFTHKENTRLFFLQVNPKDLSDQKSLDKQYVYLKASSSSPGFQFNDEIKILVSYRNAMVFIQTDKPIYTPGQTGEQSLTCQSMKLIYYELLIYQSKYKKVGVLPFYISIYISTLPTQHVVCSLLIYQAASQFNILHVRGFIS